MRDELDKLLCLRYPEMFIERHTDPTTSGMCYGFFCDDGWFELIDSICTEITKQVVTGASPPVIVR